MADYDHLVPFFHQIFHRHVQASGALMEKAGFEGVRRLDEVFYQPVPIGTRPDC